DELDRDLAPGQGRAELAREIALVLGVEEVRLVDEEDDRDRVRPDLSSEVELGVDVALLARTAAGEGFVDDPVEPAGRNADERLTVEIARERDRSLDVPARGARDPGHGRERSARDLLPHVVGELLDRHAVLNEIPLVGDEDDRLVLAHDELDDLLVD